MTFEEWMFDGEEPDDSDPRVDEWREIWQAATEQKDAEITRLRGILESIVATADEFEYESNVMAGTILNIAVKGLDTIADDWLERHDAEVREKCAVRGFWACRERGVAAKKAREIRAAIREQEGKG